jgi:hypothetical protein
MTRSFKRRLEAVEKRFGVGAWRTVVISVPHGMTTEAARARLGIPPGMAGMLVAVADFARNAGPRLLSGRVGQENDRYESGGGGKMGH